MIVYFDLDGTLIDIFDRYLGILNSFLSVYGVRQLTRSEFIYYRQMGLKEHEFVKILRNFDIQIDKYLFFKREQLELIDWLKKDFLICDMLSTSEKLKAIGLSFELITIRRNKENVNKQLEWLGLKPYFDYIHIIEPSGEKNPKIEYLKDRYSSKSIFIGDSNIDMDCGNYFKMKTYFVTTGLNGVPVGQIGYANISAVVEEICQLLGEIENGI